MSQPSEYIDVDPQRYDPLYVDVNAIPIEVEDTYSTEQKREALFAAEAELEIDYNGGYEILPDEWTSTHTKALLNLATYYLVRSATSPKDVTLGELEDGGEQKESHANQFKETYDEQIVKLAQAGGEGDSGTWYGKSGRGGATILTNRRDDQRSKRRKRRNTERLNYHGPRRHPSRDRR